MTERAIRLLFYRFMRLLFTIAFMWLFMDILRQFNLDPYLLMINGVLIGWKITGLR